MIGYKTSTITGYRGYTIGQSTEDDLWYEVADYTSLWGGFESEDAVCAYADSVIAHHTITDARYKTRLSLHDAREIIRAFETASGRKYSPEQRIDLLASNSMEPDRIHIRLLVHHLKEEEKLEPLQGTYGMEEDHYFGHDTRKGKS